MLLNHSWRKAFACESVLTRSSSTHIARSAIVAQSSRTIAELELFSGVVLNVLLLGVLLCPLFVSSQDRIEQLTFSKPR